MLESHGHSAPFKELATCGPFTGKMQVFVRVPPLRAIERIGILWSFSREKTQFLAQPPSYGALWQFMPCSAVRVAGNGLVLCKATSRATFFRLGAKFAIKIDGCPVGKSAYMIGCTMPLTRTKSLGPETRMSQPMLPDPKKPVTAVADLASQASKLHETLERLLREVKDLIERTQKISDELPSKAKPAKQPE